MAARRGRGAAAPPARKSNRKSSGPRFRLIAITIALPLLAVAAWFLYTKFTTTREATAPRQVVEAAATPPIPTQRLLEKNGIEPQRIRRHGGALEVEWLYSAPELAQRLRSQVDGKVRVDGNDVVIERPDGKTETIRVKELKTADSGAGLVEATDDPERKARIALIIDDIGFPQQPISEVTSLGIPLTFAVIPGTPNATAAAEMLSGRGFDVMCHLPMEPEGYPGVRPGEGAILTSMSDEEVYATTLRAFRSIPGAKGLNNHMGSRASADPRVMAKVVEAVRDSGAFFVDSRTSAKSVGAKTAQQQSVRFASRDVFLDDNRSDAAVRTQLRRLVVLAEERGLAVGIGHLYPATVRVLKEEIPKLQARGIEFIPAAQAVR